MEDQEQEKENVLRDIAEFLPKPYEDPKVAIKKLNACLKEPNTVQEIMNNELCIRLKKFENPGTLQYMQQAIMEARDNNTLNMEYCVMLLSKHFRLCQEGMVLLRKFCKRDGPQAKERLCYKPHSWFLRRFQSINYDELPVATGFIQYGKLYQEKHPIIFNFSVSTHLLAENRYPQNEQQLAQLRDSNVHELMEQQQPTWEPKREDL